METAVESPLSEGLSINPADSSGNSCTALASPSSLSIKSDYSSSSDSSCKSESLHKSSKRGVLEPEEKSLRNSDQGYSAGKVANCSKSTTIESVSSISSTSPPRSPDSASILRHSSSLPRNHSYSPLIHHSNSSNYNSHYGSNNNPSRTLPCLVLSPNSHGFFNPSSFYNPSQLLLPVPVFHSTMMGKMSALSSKNFDSGINRFKDFGMDVNSTNSYEVNVGKDTKDDTVSGSWRREKHDQSESSSFEQPKKLSFGMDRILSDENSKPEMTKKKVPEKRPRSRSPDSGKVESSKVQNPAESALIPTSFHPHHPHTHHHPQFHNDPHHPRSISNTTTNHIISNHPSSHNNNSGSPINLSRCTECYLVGRYCRNNNLQYSSLVSCGATPGGPANGVSSSFAPWMTSASMYENSPLLSPSAYAHLPQSALPSAYGLSSSGFSTMSSLVSCNSGSGGRRKRSWSRAVFSSLQRKGLEKRFQIQKYITKPDRRQLAATLGLTDAQVKVWFQNRRMKWRHSKEGKVTSGVGDEGISGSTASSPTSANGPISTTYSSSDKK